MVPPGVQGTIFVTFKGDVQAETDQLIPLIGDQPTEP
jgi:hypothetical protein